jgi:single-stranded DNA-binding protein
VIVVAINLVVASGIVKSPALRFDAQGRAEYRFTLEQRDGEYTLWLPCFAPGAAGERLHEQLDEGQHVVITSGRLAYKKRDTKDGERSRLEILVWSADVLSDDSTAGGSVSQEGAGEIVDSEPTSTKKPRRPRLPKHLKAPWRPSGLVSEN